MSEAPTARHAIGANHPPEPLIVEQITAWLHERTGTLATRKAELLAAATRFSAAHPSIDDDETQGRAAEFVRQLKGAVKVAEDKREAEKKPYLDGGRVVDAFFKALTEPLKGAAAGVERVMTAYAQKQEAERRRLAKIEADRLEEQARQAAERARQTMQPDALEQAAQQAQRADDAAALASARPADLSRARGDFGAVASLRQTWTIEVVDANKLPRAYMMPDTAALRLALQEAPKAADGTPQLSIAGTRLVSVEKIGVR